MLSWLVRTLRECIAESNKATEEYAEIIVTGTLKQTTVREVASAAVRTTIAGTALTLAAPALVVHCTMCVAFNKTTQMRQDIYVLYARVCNIVLIDVFAISAYFQDFYLYSEEYATVSGWTVNLLGLSLYRTFEYILVKTKNLPFKVNFERFCMIELPTAIHFGFIAFYIGMNPVHAVSSSLTWFFLHLPNTAASCEPTLLIADDSNETCRTCMEPFGTDPAVFCHACKRVVVHKECRKLWVQKCIKLQRNVTCEHCNSAVLVNNVDRKELKFALMLSNSSFFFLYKFMGAFYAMRALGALCRYKKWKTSLLEIASIAVGFHPMLVTFAAEASHAADDNVLAFVPILSLASLNTVAILGSQLVYCTQTPDQRPDYLLCDSL